MYCPSQHTQTVPARVPYVIPHGALAVFPVGTQRFLSVGCIGVPDWITHPGPAWYPYGSRLSWVKSNFLHVVNLSQPDDL